MPYRGETNLNTQVFARKLIDVIEDKKGENIVLMEISGVSVIADYFVIATGSSDRQLKALADAVAEAGEETPSAACC